MTIGDVEGFSQDQGIVIVGFAAHVFQGDGQGQKLAQGIPPQMALLEKLLHMLGS